MAPNRWPIRLRNAKIPTLNPCPAPDARSRQRSGALIRYVEEFRISAISITKVVELVGTVAVQLVSMGNFKFARSADPLWHPSSRALHCSEMRPNLASAGILPGSSGSTAAKRTPKALASASAAHIKAAQQTAQNDQISLRSSTPKWAVCCP